ncbi:hypothetical protein Pmob_1050 [Petrotoga mobilis SJ95]|uniref:DUF3996 domain-containing protein n=3 Tax=Petrotoga TaxID=28236 RepID=A9BG15_PETMO|nr:MULTISPECIES: hypothetical protein [Petrotoga]ABX31771.1 hypothetical protein Pmob_1050 [Petrotoga mobilis SJ95]PNR96547.1 hypothetical protein X929_04490 [Petrotoga olearia DSM 13574]RMA76581.1 hypothetical protein C8D75_0234 [Petrotoga olearia]
MKKEVILIIFFSVLSLIVFSNDFGLGIKIGKVTEKPAGVYMRSYIGESSFIGFTLTWTNSDYLRIDGDLEFTTPVYASDSNKGRFFSYGASLKFEAEENSINWGMYLPLTYNQDSPEETIFFFIEVAPGFIFYPEWNVDYRGGFGFGSKF